MSFNTKPAGTYWIVPIFPNLCRDAELKIFEFSDAFTLCRFGGANKAASTLLNERFFEQLFAKKYPLLAKTIKLFSYHTAHGPEFLNYRWRFACCKMESKYVPLENPPADNSLKDKFFIQSRDSFLCDLLLQKRQIKNEIAEIYEKNQIVFCGANNEELDSMLLRKGFQRYREAISCLNEAGRSYDLSFIDPFMDDYPLRGNPAVSRADSLLSAEAIAERSCIEMDPFLEPIVSAIPDRFFEIARAAWKEGEVFLIAKLILTTMLSDPGLLAALKLAKGGENLVLAEVFKDHQVLAGCFQGPYKEEKVGDLFDLKRVNDYLQVANALEKGLKKESLAYALIEAMSCKGRLMDLELDFARCRFELKLCKSRMKSIQMQIENVNYYHSLLLKTEIAFVKHHKSIFYGTPHPADRGTFRFFAEIKPCGKFGFLWEVLAGVYSGDDFIEYKPEYKQMRKQGNEFLNAYASVCNGNFNESVEIGLDQHFESIKEDLVLLKQIQQELQEKVAEKASENARWGLDHCLDLGLSSYTYRMLFLPEFQDGEGEGESYTSEFRLDFLLFRITALVVAIERRTQNKGAYSKAFESAH
jgi:hypothetical protein